jgi:site-specific recombinase XerD
MGRPRRTRIRPVPEARWFRSFERALAGSGLSGNTVRCYLHAVRRLLNWLEDHDKDFRTFGPADLKRYRQWLMSAGKPATVNFHLQAIRWLCRWAVQQRILSEDPSSSIETRQVKSPHAPTALAAGEVHRLLRAAGQSAEDLRLRDYALVQILLRTGLRVEEAVALRVGDVTAYDRSGAVRVRRRGRGGRDVPLGAEARRAIRAYLDARGNPEASEPLFTSREGQALAVRSAQTVIRNAARRAGLEQVSSQALRHTFAIHYLRDNPGKLPQLAALLGNQSVESAATYTRPSSRRRGVDLERRYPGGHSGDPA